jgi:DHA2 family multidrug resistance protein
MSERRQNFHQATIGSNAASSPWLRNAVTQTAAYLHSHGMSQTDAMAAAYARFYDQLQAQSRLLLAFMDCFYILRLVTLIAAPLVLFTRNFKAGSMAPSAHQGQSNPYA